MLHVRLLHPPPSASSAGAWSEFLAASAAAVDMDRLIAAHEAFLAAALDRSLLGGGRAEALRRTLQQLLATCSGLAPLSRRFNEKVVCWEMCCACAGGRVRARAHALQRVLACMQCMHALTHARTHACMPSCSLVMRPL